MISYGDMLDVVISIHAPARGATVNLFGLTYYFDISIHAPARGATVIPPLYNEEGYYISIHAPARGATASVNLPTISYDISIHAPARGATANTHKQLI